MYILLQLSFQVKSILSILKNDVSPGYEHKQHTKIYFLFDELSCSLTNIQEKTSLDSWSLMSIRQQIYFLYANIVLDPRFLFYSHITQEMINLFRLFNDKFN